MQTTKADKTQQKPLSREHDMLRISNSKFKKIYDSKIPKYKFLPSWLDKKSSLFEKEVKVIKNKNQKTYNRYSRGTIVYLDFGVNIGSEMTGRHFAVVITKNDSTRNGVLQVIPLTSKKKRGYIGIAKEVFNTSAILLINHIDILTDKIKKGHTELADLKKDYEKLAEQSELLSSADYEETKTRYDFSHERISGELNEAYKEQKSLSRVAVRYQVYAKDSYLCTRNIMTVSKDRLLKENKFDPAGDIKVSNETLDAIDNSIVSLFTNI